MTSQLDRDEEPSHSHRSVTGLSNLDIDSKDSNKSCVGVQKRAGEAAPPSFCKLVMDGLEGLETRQASGSSIEEMSEHAPSGCALTRSPEGLSNQLFQEILAAHLGKVQRSLSDDLQKTLQLVAAHLKTVGRLDECMDGLRNENQRLHGHLANHNGMSSGQAMARSEKVAQSENLGHRRASREKVESLLRRRASRESNTSSISKWIPGMANVDENISKHEMNGEGNSWRAVSSEGNVGRPRMSRGALKSPSGRLSGASASGSSVTFQAKGRRASGSSRQSDPKENFAPVKEEESCGVVVEQQESESDLTSCSSGSSSLGDVVAARISKRLSNKSPDLLFEVLPVWEKENVSLAAVMSESKTTVGRYMRRKSLRRMSTNLFADGDTGMDISLEIRGSSSVSHFVVHPNSMKRACWDAASFCLIVYDIIAIPFQLFEPPDHALLYGMAWLTRFFWTIDICASLNTGFAMKSGNYEMRHAPIAKRYLRTWFSLDILLVGVDWLELLWSGSSSLGFARIGKATRAFRILRMLRVLRMRQAVNLIIHRIRSERLMVMADIAKIMLVIIGFAHISACFWYGIGISKADYRTWVREGSFTEESLSYRYMTSLHWSLSQFSGGMDEVKPYNLQERTYCVFVFIVAFMMAAVLTSSLTSSMTRLHMLSTRQSQQLSVLRRFLSDNGVSRVLSARVQRNANHAMMEQQRYQQESNVELLRVISEPLKMELHFEMYSPVLSKHPFFNTYASECPHVMRKVCHRSTSMSLVSSNDIIFNAGELPLNPKMCWVCNGTLSYFSMTEQEFLVKEGDWISEGVLWTPWMHRGSLRANADCRLCELDARSFQDIVGQFDHGEFDPKDYAAHFVRKLNDHQGEVTDLHVKFLEEEVPGAPPPRRRSFDKALSDAGDSIAGVAQTLVRRISGERAGTSGAFAASTRTSASSSPVSPKSPKSPEFASPPVSSGTEKPSAVVPMEPQNGKTVSVCSPPVSEIAT